MCCATYSKDCQQQSLFIDAALWTTNEMRTKLQDHLKQLDEQSDQLTAIGEEVTELHKVAVLLQESYPTLVCT